MKVKIRVYGLEIMNEKGAPDISRAPLTFRLSA